MIMTLIRINLQGLFAGLFRRYRKRKKMNPVAIILIILLVLYVLGTSMFSFGLMFSGLCTAFFEANIGWLYFASIGIMIFTLCFVSSIYMTQAQLFNARDNQLLLAMPVKPSAILAGRIFSMLTLEYLFELFVIIPSFAVLIITGNIQVLPVAGIMNFIITALFIPLPALALGCFTGWLVAIISSRMRNKNIPVFVLTLLITGGYVWLNSKLSAYIQTLIAERLEIAAVVRRAILPAYHLGMASAAGSLYSLIIFILFAVVPFALMYLLLAKSFHIITATNRGAKKIQYREKPVRVTRVRTALLQKEIRRFFANPMYVLNAGMGMLFALVFSAVLLVRPAVILNVINPLTESLPALNTPILAVTALLMLTSMNIMTAPSISLEGAKLWLIKSLPVRTRDILLSKAQMQIVLGGIPLIIAGIVSIIRIPGMSITACVVMIAAPMMLNIVLALFGVTMNLLFPRFDWLNEMQPIKQSISVMLTMFGSVSLISILGVVYVLWLQPVISSDLYLLLCTGLFALMGTGLYMYLITAGARRFEAL